MLDQHIRQKKSGIILYGLTPPKANNTHEEVQEIAARQCARLEKRPIDGVVVYDLQDEAERTESARPFPFLETIDPAMYATAYLGSLSAPSVLYRAVGKYSKEQTRTWLEAHNKPDCLSVFVGAASRTQKVSLSMQEAYALKRDVAPHLLLGGIAIPERHMKKHDEHERVVRKVEEGCAFFVTQAVYDLEASKRFLDDYVALSRAKHLPLVPIIFTLTPCGSEKTLAFMKWLGIHISPLVEEMLLGTEDMLEVSMAHMRYVAKMLYMYGTSKGIPVGFNIESVAIRKAEIEASIALIEDVKHIVLNKA
ncbi:MAG: methylenetetrahydrofolate reductase [Campylobacterales bacterium]|nr:methylenetetrahydrofolate reductase [Campylobacterales bacterium]